MCKKSLWLVVPFLLILSWAAYTWHLSTHDGPFIQFPDSHPELTSPEAMKKENGKLVAKIENLAKSEEVILYLESIGFTCKSYQGEDLKSRMASEDEISSHYCVYAYGMFGHSHEWRVGYSV